MAPSAAPVTAGDVLTLAELQDLRRLSGPRGAALVAHAWATIAGAMALYAAFPSGLTLAVAVAVVGSRQVGLMVLVHEAAHWRLLPGARANDRLARWLCAHPLGVDLPAYRRRHHLHHRHARRPEDPDLALAPLAGTPGRALLAAALRDLAGVTAAARLLAWRPWRGGAAPAWRRLRGPLAAHAVILAAAAALGRWWLYPLLWLLPLATWYPLATRLREVAEHGGVPDDADPLRNARTVTAGRLERALVAPYWVHHHVEHHLLVFVPCWKLRAARALLLARGHGARMEVAGSYVEALRRVTSARG